ncbi:MAG: SUMF1/EgtB/PvdO family nonheme iron enzyme [Acidobacteria bacterium]|nr:SUMF1/EgtB/PvdO family nonheme iron enzyme [Acidobacteriota bacterium]
MLNRKLFITVLWLGCLGVAASHAQDPSGRDLEKKAPIKTATPKPAPRATPVIKPIVTKPAQAPAKPKANKAIVATNKPATPPPAPTTSRLTLTAVPNAQIEIAGRSSGVTGADGKLVVNEIPIGSHSLKITAEGYEPWSGTLEAKAANTDFNVSMKKRAMTGTLVISVNQPGVEIFINDKLNVKSVGGRSITVEGLLPGTHQVRAIKAGFKEWRGVTPVNVGETRPLEVTMVPGISLETVRVAAGEFMMGNNNGPKDSSPAHPVSLGEFEISTREVTNQLYKAFLDAAKHPAPNPQLSGWQSNNFPAGKADAPVTGITWDDTQAFCQWLSREAGGTYRLPTEAEWERATRLVGGTYQTVSVAWEWCQDWYDPEYYQRKDRLSPQGPALKPTVSVSSKTPAGRVIRGGATNAAARAVRVFERNAMQPDTGRSDLGFRVVREAFIR